MGGLGFVMGVDVIVNRVMHVHNRPMIFELFLKVRNAERKVAHHDNLNAETQQHRAVQCNGYVGVKLCVIRFAVVWRVQPCECECCISVLDFALEMYV